MVKYLTVVLIHNNIAYYTMTTTSKSNTEHSRLLYKFLKAFTNDDIKSFVIRSSNINSAVNELTEYLKQIKSVTFIQRKRLPHTTEQFSEWIIQGD